MKIENHHKMFCFSRNVFLQFILLVIIIFFAICVLLCRNVNTIKNLRGNTEEFENHMYWNDRGRKELEKALKISTTINTNIAKNIILFIGDGMSLPTLTAARIYKAQEKGRKKGEIVHGEESSLTFQKFPHMGLSKTYCIDRQTPDSAATASAIYSGVKTKFETLGFDASIIPRNISSQLQAFKVESILTWAQEANKATGFVTNSRVSHATPAALYAHSAHRDYECDKKLPSGAQKKVKDITLQLVEDNPGRGLKVVMGGGSIPWMSKEEHDINWKREPRIIHPDHKHENDSNFDCYRLDGKNLVTAFLNKNKTDQNFKDMKGKVIKNRDELLRLDVRETDYLLGLFSDNHMEYEDIRRIPKQTQPSLSEMTKAAIQILQKNNDEKGLFLMVENDFIDHAHHNNRASGALLETMVLDEAVEAAMNMLNTEDTLIIVTADHSHTMTMGGYQTRGSDIRGIVDTEVGNDNLPYTILSYANGPGFGTHLSAENEQDDDLIRLNLTGKEDWYTSYSFQNPSSVPTTSETHGGDDVAIFAIGPYSHLFHSVHEQSYIAYVMAYSSCLGPYKNDIHCRFPKRNSAPRNELNATFLLTITSSIFVVIQ